MIVVSKLTHVYRLPRVGVTIVPGTNMFNDVVGRRLVRNEHFQETLKYKNLELQVVIPPKEATKAEAEAEKKAEEKAREVVKKKLGGKLVLDKGGAPTADLKPAEAVKFINDKLMVNVDTLQAILTGDDRPEVQAAASAKLDVLRREAESTPTSEGGDADAQ